MKKEKPTNIKDEDSSLPHLPPSPAVKPLPPYEGSTQASFSSIADFVPDLKKPVATPTITTGLQSPMGAKSFDAVFNSSSPSPSPSSAVTVVTTPLKPKLIPTKHITPIAATANSSTTSQLKNPSLSLSKSKTSSPLAKSTSAAASLSSSKAVPTSGISARSQSPAHVVAMPTAKGAPQKSKIVKNPLNTVAQKGPTKVTKITAPSGLNLSQKEINAIINTLKNTPVSLSPQQQVHLLLQHSPTLKAPPIVTPPQPRKSSSHSATTTASLPLTKPKPTTTKPVVVPTRPTMQPGTGSQNLIPSQSHTATIPVVVPARPTMQPGTGSQNLIPSQSHTATIPVVVPTRPTMQPGTGSQNSIPSQSHTATIPVVVPTRPTMQPGTGSQNSIPSQSHTATMPVWTAPVVVSPSAVPGKPLPPRHPQPHHQGTSSIQTKITFPDVRPSVAIGTPTSSPINQSAPRMMPSGFSSSGTMENRSVITNPSVASNKSTASLPVIPSSSNKGSAVSNPQTGPYSIGPRAHTISVVPNLLPSSTIPIVYSNNSSVSTEHSYVPMNKVPPPALSPTLLPFQANQALLLDGKNLPAHFFNKPAADNSGETKNN